MLIFFIVGHCTADVEQCKADSISNGSESEEVAD